MQTHGIEIDKRNRYLYRRYGMKIIINPNDDEQIHQMIFDLDMRHIYPEDVVIYSPLTQ